MDSEPIVVTKKPNDLISIAVDSVTSIPFKFLSLMFLTFILLSTDVFIGRILGSFDGAVDYLTPTSWGVCIQGMFLVFAMVIIDALIKQQVI